MDDGASGRGGRASGGAGSLAQSGTVTAESSILALARLSLAARIPHLPVGGDWSAAQPRRIGGSVGENRPRRFKALGPVHSHHPSFVRQLARIALDVDRAAGEPGEEAIERGGFVELELERA